MTTEPTGIRQAAAFTIREARIAAGLPQRVVAQRYGCTRAHLCKLESGSENITVATMERVAAALGCQFYFGFDFKGSNQ